MRFEDRDHLHVALVEGLGQLGATVRQEGRQRHGQRHDQEQDAHQLRLQDVVRDRLPCALPGARIQNCHQQQQGHVQCAMLETSFPWGHADQACPA
jgi:hypothetical protein